MTEELKVKIYTASDLERYTSVRDGETKVGQAVSLLQSSAAGELDKNLAKAVQQGARYAIVLIPEDIGPRANCGRDGADKAPEAFLSFFTNMQSNRFFDYSKVVLVGEVDVDDLMLESKGSAGDSLEGLRGLCERLDILVAPIIRYIVAAGLEPIVIGGGNNNSLPVIRGVVEVLCAGQTDGIACINCDPHADFRRMEGRHSGNPFTYAHAAGYLKRYCVFGLHENYNSEEMLARLEQAGFCYFSYEDFAIRQSISFEQSIAKACDYLSRGNLPIGLELDLDGIQRMPASAKTPFGITEEQSLHFIHSIAAKLNTRYLHLSEAAPKWSAHDGMREVGKSMAIQVVTYLKAREQYRQQHSEVFRAPITTTAQAMLHR